IGLVGRLHLNGGDAGAGEEARQVADVEVRTRRSAADVSCELVPTQAHAVRGDSDWRTRGNRADLHLYLLAWNELRGVGRAFKRALERTRHGQAIGIDLKLSVIERHNDSVAKVDVVHAAERAKHDHFEMRSVVNLEDRAFELVFDLVVFQ